jgi:parallel beta-helix repeat protein
LAQTGSKTNVHYIDPTAIGPGNGTLASPFRSWTSVSWTPGHTYLQKRGTTYSGVFKVSASGTAAQRITIGAYYRSNGNDDPSKPKPVIILPGASTTPADGASIAVYKQERDFITYRNLDIRNNALPDVSDVAIIWLGNNCVFENNNVTSNRAGVYIFAKNHVTVSGCVLDVISQSTTYGNQGILVAANANIDDIRLVNNTVRHYGGGTTKSHGIRCETYDSAFFLTHLVIRGNRVSPPTGVDYTPNPGAMGIYLIQGDAATLDSNTVTGMLVGIFINSGDRSYVGKNNCSNNMNFGIHIGGRAKSYTIENNVCNANGGDFATNWYGRGIELNSATGSEAVSGHTIRYNTCRFNRNCSVYGNIVSNNEGNGIQVYGGGDKNKWLDTGGHTISSNTMDSNCTVSVLNRRSGGTTPSPFQAHIALVYIYGSPTTVSNNTFSGSTPMGIYTDRSDSNITIAGNV